jgi:hypothetical protein
VSLRWWIVEAVGPRPHHVREALLDTMPSNNQETPVPQPTKAKQIMPKIAQE